LHKRVILLILTVLLIRWPVDGSTLKSAAINETPERLRLVLTLDSPAKYSIIKKNSSSVIKIPDTIIKPGVPRSIASSILENLKIERKNDACVITASYKYLTSSNVTILKDPSRIVIDYKKLSKMLIPKITVPEIEKIITRSYPDKFKIIVYLTSFVPYKVSTAEGGLMIELPDANSIIKSRKIVTKDRLIPKVGIDQIGKSVMISIAQNYPSFYQIYKSENPSALVIEFDKTSKSTVSANLVSAGLRTQKLIKGTEEGPSTVNVLIVDQTTLEVFPYLANRTGSAPNLFEAIGGIFTFWTPKEETKYQKDRVSNMVKDSGAIAGVNGTFFGWAGEPLGVLMINGELVSYSINDRTALIIDKKNRCYIDNVSLYGEASVEGVTIQISGINNKRQAGEAVIYTPRYGKETSEDSPGIILSIIGDEVKNVSRARGWIPQDGYALSLDPNYYDLLGNRVRAGSRINLSLKLLPLSSIPDLEIKHVIGGGPRLLKAGQIYISKNSERFKSDIAKSRAARTAVGITKDGMLAFVTVDKIKQTAGSAKSVGVTLEELASIMKDIDCVDAMNLDGGGSSTMVLSSEVINSPANGYEIAVSNGILIR